MRLYIDFSSKPSADSLEVSEGVVVDYDADGNVVGIDVDNASRKVDFATFSSLHSRGRLCHTDEAKRHLRL